MAGLFDFLNAPVQEDPQQAFVRTMMEQIGVPGGRRPTRGSRLRSALSSMAMAPERNDGNFGAILAAGGEGLAGSFDPADANGGGLAGLAGIMNAMKPADRPDALEINDWYANASEEERRLFEQSQRAMDPEKNKAEYLQLMQARNDYLAQNPNPRPDDPTLRYIEERLKHLTEFAPPNVNSTTVYTPFETEGDKTLGKGVSEQILAGPEEINKVTTALSRLSQAKGQIDGMATGYPGGALAIIQTGMEGLGLGSLVPQFIKSATAGRDSFVGAMNNVVVETLGGLGAQISNADVSFMSRAFGDVNTQTKGGLKAIVTAQQAVLGFKRRYLAEKTRFLAANRHNADAAATMTQHMDEWSAKNPIFTPEIEAEINSYKRDNTPSPWTEPGSTAPGTNAGAGSRALQKFRTGANAP